MFTPEVAETERRDGQYEGTEWRSRSAGRPTSGSVESEQARSFAPTGAGLKMTEARTGDTETAGLRPYGDPDESGQAKSVPQKRPGRTRRVGVNSCGKV